MTFPNRPAAHSPLHAEEVRPWVPPKVPAGHCVHNAVPPTLYWPVLHMSAVLFVEPAGHAYPAEQAPLQVGTVNPDDAP